MKIFCDTSVLVASVVRAHPHHARALPVVQRVTQRRDRGFVGGHGLAEMYAVLTGLPLSPRIGPGAAGALVLENVVGHFDIVVLTSAEYAALIRKCAQQGVTGGAVYDALLLRCAEKAGAERVFTFNVTDFRRLAPDLADRVVAP